MGGPFSNWEREAIQALDRKVTEWMEKDGDTTISAIIQMDTEAGDDTKQEIRKLCEKRDEDRYVTELGSMPMIAGTFCRATLRDAAHHAHVQRIFYDYEVHAYLDKAVPTVLASEAHAKWDVTGKGVAVAVVDTGVATHEDLTKPENRIVAFHDLVGNQKEPYDDNGHGTHVSGIIAGNGFRSDGKYVGSAPEANIVGVKVLDQAGSGRVSTIMKGLEWCIQEKETYNIRVINLSLGGPATEPYTDDPLSQMVEQAWHRGIVVCAAAGNEGPSGETIGSPGFNPFILTVGSTNDQNTDSPEDDRESEFSSRGPTVDHFNKPDLLAPGERIVSLLAKHSPMAKEVQQGNLSSPDEGYVELSGTSMSSPLCAGIAALLLQYNEHLSPNDVKAILVSSAQHLKGSSPGYVHTVNALELAKTYLKYRTTG